MLGLKCVQKVELEEWPGLEGLEGHVEGLNFILWTIGVIEEFVRRE